MTQETQTGVRTATPEDHAAIMRVAGETAMFEPDELGKIDQMLSAHFANAQAATNWLVADTAPVQGAALAAPDLWAADVWTLWFIGVLPSARGTGVGRALITGAEALAKGSGARLMIVETASTRQFLRARMFYQMAGYTQDGAIRDFYGPGADKIVYRKHLS